MTEDIEVTLVRTKLGEMISEKDFDIVSKGAVVLAAIFVVGLIVAIVRKK